jgi:serine/threonine protein kinase
VNTRQLIGSRFEIADRQRDLIGRGGMGDVYRARDTHTGHTVAAKVLRPELITRDPDAIARFLREGEALRQLNHPVQWYLPEFTGEGKEAVMVDHLLTHTSGIRDEETSAYVERKKGSVEIPLPEKTQHPRVQEELYLAYDVPLCEPPGTEMSYSSYG